MTTVIFVRHAEPNLMNHDDLTRELSAKGGKDRLLVTKFLQARKIQFLFSSPYRRAIDTISDFAEKSQLEITPINAFRERRVGMDWIADFDTFCRLQWQDFSYRLEGGESLREVQVRNVQALTAILKSKREKTIAIGSHGTALSTVINYFDSSFGYLDFLKIKDLMPWIVQFDFEGLECKAIQSYNLFEL